MVESKHAAPHAWTMVEVDVTDLWAWRMAEKDAFEREHGIRLTLLPFFMFAVDEIAARLSADERIVPRERHRGARERQPRIATATTIA